MIHTYHCCLSETVGSSRSNVEEGVAPRVITGPYFTPKQVAQLYNFPSDVDGTGQTVGIINLSGGYTLPDFQAYLTSIGVTKVPTVIDVPVNGGFNNPADTSGANYEVCLDLDVVAAVAPGATIRMYFAPTPSFSNFLAAVQAAIADNCNIISISWGLAELYWDSNIRSQMNTAFSQAAANGISVFAAAGDNGASDGFTGLNVDFPSSSPFVIACGGTTLTVANGVIANEVVWGNSTNSATGGGLSAVFSKPSYQSSVPLLNTQSTRASPDISANANPNSGYIIRVGSSNVVVGGTSAVSPLLSGFTALLNQKRAQSSLGRLGQVHLPLYAAPLSVFRDIVSGTNFGYNAAVGWDYTSGLGTPSSALVTYLTSYTPTQPAPVASFTASVTSGVAPLVVTFVDTSSNTATLGTTWAWNFGNGQTSNVQFPSPVTFSSAGSYNVTLTVSNTYGSSVATTTVVVNPVPVTPLPVAKFSVTPSSGVCPVTVTLSNQSTGATSYLWEFGSGAAGGATSTTAASPQPVTFTKTGTNTIKLTATNSAGSQSTTQSVFVQNGPPLAAFSYLCSTVNFVDTSINNPVSYSWDFGDGSPLIVDSRVSKTVFHKYGSAGTYTVKHNARNAAGLGNEVSVALQIQSLPAANSQSGSGVAWVSARGSAPVVSFKTQCRTFTFTDTSSCTPTTWKWTFGDGTTSLLRNPVKAFTRAGTFTVTLRVSNYLGNSTMSQNIIVT